MTTTAHNRAEDLVEQMTEGDTPPPSGRLRRRKKSDDAAAKAGPSGRSSRGRPP